MWRRATASDDEAIVSMCMALNAEDPGPNPLQPQQVRRTLAKLREEPNRGRAVVCDVESRTVGYALLISFWSNELGGESAILMNCLLLRCTVGVAWRHPSLRNVLTRNNRYGQSGRQR
jgi:hypothetical protein